MSWLKKIFKPKTITLSDITIERTNTLRSPVFDVLELMPGNHVCIYVKGNQTGVMVNGKVVNGTLYDKIIVKHNLIDYLRNEGNTSDTKTIELYVMSKTEYFLSNFITNNVGLDYGELEKLANNLNIKVIPIIAYQFAIRTLSELVNLKYGPSSLYDGDRIGIICRNPNNMEEIVVA